MLRGVSVAWRFAQIAPSFRVAVGERDMLHQKDIWADPTKNEAKSEAFSDATFNIFRNKLFLIRYGFRQATILRQRSDSRRPIIRLNEEVCVLYIGLSG